MANNPLNNRWTQPSNPPPPLFVGKAERDFVKQINDEVIEHVVGQQVLYFPIDQKLTKYNVYGEALEKTFLPPIRVYSLVDYEGSERTQTEFGFDSLFKIKINFHKRRLSQDQDLFVRPGDFVQYDMMYFEIVDVFEDARFLFGQDKNFADGIAFSVQADCLQARKGLFNPGKGI
jgi:hypothetical protein